MTIDQQSEQRSWQNTLSLALSALGILVFILLAILLAFVGSSLSGFLAVPEAQLISVGVLAWAMLLCSLALGPFFLLSLRAYRGHPVPTWLELNTRPRVRKVILWSILAWPVMVLAGRLVAGSPELARFLLGPINILVAGLPILWILNLAQWQLKGGSPLRKWGLFGFSLTVTPALIMVLEIIAAIILMGGIGLWLSARGALDPALNQALNDLLNQFNSGGEDIEVLIQSLEPLLLQPAVIIWGLVVFAGVMPIIEEIVKPLAVWVLAGKHITQAEGYVSGLLAGAGFALLENVLFFTTATGVDDWTFLAIGRAGTGVLHMLASGLVGLGLARMWREGKWLTQALMTVGAILLHGLWNALSLISGIAPLASDIAEFNFSQTILAILPTIALLIFSALMMIIINRRFHRQDPSKAIPVTIQAPSEENRINHA